MTHPDSQDGRLEGEKDGVVMKVEPMGMLLTMLAGWVNRHQQDVIIS